MARPKLGDSDTERLHLKITKNEIEEIDDWRYANRVPSRSEAVRRLVQIGLTFDANAQDLREVFTSMTGSFEVDGRKMVDALGPPSDQDPPWLSDYIISSASFGKSVGDSLKRMAKFLRRIEQTRAVMKTDGTIGDALEAMDILQLENLASDLERRVAEYQQGEEGEK